jgi:hypothetical protein
MNITLTPEHVDAIVGLAAHRASVGCPVALVGPVIRATVGTIVVAVVLGGVVLSAIATALGKVKLLIADFVGIATKMMSVLLVIVVVIVGAGFFLIHH